VSFSLLANKRAGEEGGLRGAGAKGEDKQGGEHKFRILKHTNRSGTRLMVRGAPSDDKKKTSVIHPCLIVLETWVSASPRDKLVSGFVKKFASSEKKKKCGNTETKGNYRSAASPGRLNAR